MNKHPPTNICRGAPSRKQLRPGDVFVVQMPDGRHVVGRVIRTDACVHSMQRVILIYLYRGTFESKSPPPPQHLSPSRLLVPPLLINRLPWSRGYFQTVAHWPLKPGGVLAQHCFFDHQLKRHVDEYGNPVLSPTTPCGELGLQSFRTVDDAISDALGIARAPD